MEETIVVILGGGQGSRLFPLTKVRSKPAVPIAGKYRLIDIPVSNAINSGLKKIFILTQYNSHSLNSHITRTYRFDHFSEGFVEILAAEQTDQHLDWYQGTADAVRKHWHRFDLPRSKYTLILGGDHLYRMDYRKMIAFHEANNADITVSVVPVSRAVASSFGILGIDEDGRIVEFYEKPKDPAVLDRMVAPPETLARLGFSDPERPYLASMGIYLFDRRVLGRQLSDHGKIDFGHHIIPQAINDLRVFAYVFDDYWEDIGTIRAFYEANIDLGDPAPNFHFYRADAPIYTRPRYLPGSKLYDCRVHNSVISEGCLIRDSVIEQSVIGIRSRIDRGCQVRRAVLMGADLYGLPAEREENSRQGIPDIGIGPNVILENAIVDKNARIGEGAIIRNEAGLQHHDGDFYCIRDGVVVIPKDAIVPPGAVI